MYSSISTTAGELSVMHPLSINNNPYATINRSYQNKQLVETLSNPYQYGYTPAAASAATVPAPITAPTALIPSVSLDKQLPTAKVCGIEFGMVRQHEIAKLSHLQIVNRDLYELNRLEPILYGPLDRRLGTSAKKNNCLTCNKSLADCIGHFGHIPLQLPIFHIGYFKETIRILQLICKSCSRILLTDTEQRLYRKRLRQPNRIDPQRSNQRLSDELAIICKKRKYCPHCNSENGPVKKLSGIFKLIHDIKSGLYQRQLLYDSKLAINNNPTLREYISKSTIDLNPLIVQFLFKSITDNDCELLNLNRSKGRPEDMIINSIIVPPACIRPSVAMGTSGSNEDDLTVKLGELVFINKVIRDMSERGATPMIIMENWDFLQQQSSMLINSDLPGFPKVHIKPIRGLVQRLKGKTGRFRGNLSGKRVDFSSRTVISPDPNLRIDEVGVPEQVAKILTYPERVHKYNINQLRQLILNGPDKHPGAMFVDSISTGSKHFLKYGNRSDIAGKLRYGDIVERHIRNGDIVLFNRQPSLHRMSIMAHKARILQWRTFRFNECVCAPYNADFDGDEMNLHVPQTEEARTEAATLMSVKLNLITPRHGEPLITATQDFLTTAFLLTQKDVFYDRAEFIQLCCYTSDAAESLEIPIPAILKPIRLFTGKQLFSMIIRPNSEINSNHHQYYPKVNIELKERNYDSNLYLSAADGYVCFRDSELMCGNIAKTTIGGDKSGLLYCLIRDFGADIAAETLNRLAKFSARWIGNRGFSIGIDDVTPSDQLIKTKELMLARGYQRCSDTIHKFNSGKLESAPGCDQEQTLESLCLGELSSIREELGSHCLRELDSQHNSPLIMAVCGSKGSKINISQMISCVGQQAVSGHRIPNGFVNRTLPHFPPFSREPSAKGFVSNSFFSGLNATEFFFHTVGGREGLVDTAVKTAETGYMQRRLMKALEDLCVQYDGTVRSSEQNIVQFIYGDDGLDPLFMAQGSNPVQFYRLMEQVRANKSIDNNNNNTIEKCLLPIEIRTQMEILNTPYYTKLCSENFLTKLKLFLNQYISELENLFISVGINPNNGNPLILNADTSIGWYVINNSRRLTAAQLDSFLRICREKYNRSQIESGTAVGAIAAQSIGEPGTQMTLKTFHFAGVASMNITLGVPRIKEIINASKRISSPIITAPLDINNSVGTARIVKGRIERTLLSEVSSYIEQVFTPGSCYIQIKLNTAAIDALQLGITVDTVAQSIVLTKKLKLTYRSVQAQKDGISIRIYAPDREENKLMFTLQRIKTALPSVIVQGVPNVTRAVINDIGSGKYNLLVEGYNLLGVMGTLGVAGLHCTSNHIEEMRSVLGIEAARLTIMREIHTTMDSHGLSIDNRHVSLLADIMTYRGEVLGITRFGVAKMKASTLMLASFEKTADHLYEAAIRGTTDSISGVSECIIMGVPIPVGTGLFNLLYSVKSSNINNDRDKPRTIQFDKRKLLLNQNSQHIKI